MAKKQRIPKQQFHDSAEQAFYEVTFKPIIDQKLKFLPSEIREELDAIYAKLETAPNSVLPRLLELKRQYPKIPLIYNFLSVAYGHIDLHKQKLAIEENYRLHPDYLFARCHFAEMCLAEGMPEKIPTVFDNAFDLKSLYPRRNRFHISEYAAFASVLCKYFHATGKNREADDLLQAFKYLAPQHPDVKMLEGYLHPGRLRQAVSKITAWLKK